MDFREFHEEEFVLGNGVEKRRGGENHAMGGAESGNKNGERYDFTGPRPEDGSDRRGRDSVTHGHFSGADFFYKQKTGYEIEPYKNQRAHQKSAREGLLRVNDFTGAVGAELPAFVSPKDGDHR